ncbi:transcription termination factor 4, mitochondrial isoform X2 [Loxodonta africana]|uniref:transcription termination factor 4, mitochondrial isoform X2 n=1 Tax=Loxodonta africana TaxID=9785 RepID=UPI0030CE3576
MAALGRQVIDWHRLMRLTWATIARQTSHLREQRMTVVSLLRPLTTASRGGSLKELSCVTSRKYMQEAECRTDLSQCLLEKPGTPVDRGALGLEAITTSLLDMGFSDAHIRELLSIQPRPTPQQLLDITSELILLGLNPEPVCVVLKKSPQLLKLPVKQMKKRSTYLRKLGLGEGKLKSVLYCCPEIFTMRQRDINDIVRVLREKCLFTVQQVTEILHRCPYVLREDPGELEYKFQITRETSSPADPHYKKCYREFFRQRKLDTHKGMKSAGNGGYPGPRIRGIVSPQPRARLPHSHLSILHPLTTLRRGQNFLSG